jgi:hypothetical protein
MLPVIIKDAPHLLRLYGSDTSGVLAAPRMARSTFLNARLRTTVFTCSG